MVGYSPWGHKETRWATKPSTTHIGGGWWRTSLTMLSNLWCLNSTKGLLTDFRRKSSLFLLSKYFWIFQFAFCYWFLTISLWSEEILCMTSYLLNPTETLFLWPNIWSNLGNIPVYMRICMLLVGRVCCHVSVRFIYFLLSACSFHYFFSVLSIFASFMRLFVIRNVNVYSATARRYIKLVLKYNVLLCLL